MLVTPGEGRKDAQTQRWSGRARDNRLVHIAVPTDSVARQGSQVQVPRPRDLVSVGVTYGAPHHLIADSGVHGGGYAVRRTRGGDAWAAAGTMRPRPAQGQARPDVRRRARGHTGDDRALRGARSLIAAHGGPGGQRDGAACCRGVSIAATTASSTGNSAKR